MATKSMAVRPCPIDIDTGHPRAPSDRDPRWGPREDFGGSFVIHRKWNGPWGYAIKRVTNSVDYHPGWHLTKEQTQALIDAGWTISVLSKG